MLVLEGEREREREGERERKRERETLFARGVSDASSYGGKGTGGSSRPYMPYIYHAEVFLKPFGKYQALLGSFRNPTT